MKFNIYLFNILWLLGFFGSLDHFVTAKNSGQIEISWWEACLVSVVWPVGSGISNAQEYINEYRIEPK